MDVSVTRVSALTTWAHLSMTGWKKKEGRARGGYWVFARACWAEANGLAHLGAGLARAKYGLFLKKSDKRFSSFFQNTKQRQLLI